MKEPKPWLGALLDFHLRCSQRRFGSPRLHSLTSAFGQWRNDAPGVPATPGSDVIGGAKTS